MIIAFEGIDGAGKSTQIKRISDWLINKGLITCITYEPTNGIHGQNIRNSINRLSSDNEIKEFILDRTDHVNNCIKPAVKKDEIVLTDRYYYSSMAYQGSRIASEKRINSESELESIVNNIRIENEKIAPQADILILFELSVECSMNRIKKNRNYIDKFETVENLNRVSKAFNIVKHIVENTSNTKIIVVNAENDPDTITDSIINSINKLI